MTDRTGLKATCRELANRLEGHPQTADLKAVFLDISILVGEIQGALNEAIRTGGTKPQTQAAEASFEQLKNSVRQVGFDIRLASPAALQVGMLTALDHAVHTLDCLDENPA